MQGSVWAYNTIAQGKGYFTIADVKIYTLQTYPGPITQLAFPIKS